MPPAYTTAQRNAIAQFVTFTSVKDSAAAKALKATGWNLELAVDAFYQKSGGPKPPSPGISKIFDEFRDDPSSPDQIGIEGTMNYLTAVTAKLEEPVMLAIQAVVGAETMGELCREPFASGWETLALPTGVADTLPKQKEAVEHMRTQLTSDPDFFKRVYKHSFLLAKPVGQKSVQLDAASEFWRMLYGSGGMGWDGKGKEGGEDWLEKYITYLEEHWKKSVSRDLWDQTLVFARKTMEDGTLAWWNEEASWPSVLDGFAAEWKGKVGKGEEMDTA